MLFGKRNQDILGNGIMERKKIIILIVLGILAVASLVNGFTANPKSRQKDTPSQAMSYAGRPVPENIVYAKRVAKRTTFDSWGRDPFSIRSSVSGRTSSGFNLGGIIWLAEGWKAIVDDAIIKIGDTIGGKKVVDIKKDKVILNDGTKNSELKLE